MGGAVGQYGFSSVSDAHAVAKYVWNAYLGGTDATVARPLGTASLDGADLDLEGGSPAYYSDFVRGLRTLMSQGTSSRRFLITAAPQCPFPDAWHGPKAGTALGDSPLSFDYIWVQFYNNYCQYNGASTGLIQVCLLALVIMNLSLLLQDRILTSMFI